MILFDSFSLASLCVLVVIVLVLGESRYTPEISCSLADESIVTGA